MYMKEFEKGGESMNCQTCSFLDACSRRYVVPSLQQVRKELSLRYPDDRFYDKKPAALYAMYHKMKRQQVCLKIQLNIPKSYRKPENRETRQLVLAM